MNLKRTAACYAQQSFFFLRGTILNALRFALRIVRGKQIYSSRLPRSAERGKRIFTGGAATANGLLSNGGCKGSVKIGLHLYNWE